MRESKTSALIVSQSYQKIRIKFALSSRLVVLKDHLLILSRSVSIQGDEPFLSYLSCILANSWGTTVDVTNSFFHSSQFFAFRSI